MLSHEVLREAAEKVGVKALAAELRLSPAMVYKWCEEASADEPDASGARNPLDRIRDIVRFTGHTQVVHWLCEQADGFFVENPTVRTERVGGALLLETQSLVQAFSKLLDEVSRSADDAHISAAEADRIRDSWGKLKSTGEAFVVACERGLFLRGQRSRA